MLTDLSGSTIFSTDYQPFGHNYGASGSETFMFTGKPFDSTTGLYYYGARYYNPAISRFITEDEPTTCSCKNTTKSVQENPLGLNRYIYALDNPLRFVDRNGHDTYEECKIVVFVAIEYLLTVNYVAVVIAFPEVAFTIFVAELFGFDVITAVAEYITQLICNSYQQD